DRGRGGGPAPARLPVRAGLPLGGGPARGGADGVQPPGRFWTCWKPNRPLMHRCPCVTEWSDGLETLTICPCCTCSSRLQPTPQNEQIVVVTVSCSGSHCPASRSSCSRTDLSAPVGHTPMQLPQ